MFGVKKPILAMCHLRALPTDPHYDKEKGLKYVIDCARKDLYALQDGGVDGIIFSNEYSQPYLQKVDTITVAAMARIIGELRSEITVPFGIDCIADPYASLDLAVATEAAFIREPISGSFASVYIGDINLEAGRVIRHRDSIGASHVRIISYPIPEAADYHGTRPIEEIARITEFHVQPDALTVTGMTAGSPADSQVLYKVKNSVKHTPVFVNTGCTKDTVVDQLRIADGAICATTFKYGGVFENLVDVNRVIEFMKVVCEYRRTLC